MIDQKIIFEYFLSVVDVFSAHFIWSICISSVLWYFNKLYKRKHLKLWSLSWLAYALHLIFAFAAFYLASADGPTFLHLLFIFLYCIAAFMQVVWLLSGINHLISKRSLSSKWEFIIYALVVLLSVTTTVLYLFFDDYQRANSLIIPISIKSLVFGLAFITAGIVTMRAGRKQQAVGKKLLWITFLLFGFQSLGYFKSMFQLLFDKSYLFEVSNLYGAIDFLLLSLMGIGMVIWLLEDERALLVKTNKELDSFLYSTSHDLRAPVASLLGLINLAKHDIKEEQGKEYIVMMEDRVKKLDAIFSDILNYSRNIKTDIKRVTFRLGEIVDDVISDVKFNDGADSIRLDYDEELFHLLRTDYYQLKVVLSNLISNAVKYHDSTKKDQWIGVRFERFNKDVQITISDNGKGIHPESQHKVFDMFYRASSEADGSGLGLFIVKQALDKINGHIRLSSELGKGSAFKVLVYNAAVDPIVPKNA